MEYDEQTKKSDDYLTTLEKAKEQYREYVEVSKIDDLPIFNEEQPIENSPPGIENPLTINTFHLKGSGRWNRWGPSSKNRKPE